MSSAGNITLTAGGSISEGGADTDVDVVANLLTLTAGTGITGLELAVNDDTDNQVRRTAERAVRNLNTKSDPAALQAEIKRLRTDLDDFKRKVSEDPNPDD